MVSAGMIFRKEPFFYGHDNYDQLVKIAKVRTPVQHPCVSWLFKCLSPCGAQDIMSHR